MVLMYEYCAHLRLLLSVFFNDTATTEIYTLSLHDALPISSSASGHSSATLAGTAASPSSNWPSASGPARAPSPASSRATRDRKSTRLNSSHANISYAVFCLKKNKNIRRLQPQSHQHNDPSP